MIMSFQYISFVMHETIGIFTSRHDIAVLQSVLKGILEISLVFRPQGKQIIFQEKVISLKIFRKKMRRNNT